MKPVLLKVGLALFGVIFVGILFFCVFLAPSSDIVVRTDSPGGNFVALVEETHGGRSKTFGYNVLVEPKSSSNSRVLVARLVGAKRNQKAYGVDVFWTAPYTVSITYLNAEDALIPNANVRCGGGIIHVEAKSGVLNIKAPEGGMLQNLELEKKKEIFGDGK